MASHLRAPVRRFEVRFPSFEPIQNIIENARFLKCTSDLSWSACCCSDCGGVGVVGDGVVLLVMCAGCGFRCIKDCCVLAKVALAAMERASFSLSILADTAFRV